MYRMQSNRSPRIERADVAHDDARRNGRRIGGERRRQLLCQHGVGLEANPLGLRPGAEVHGRPAQPRTYLEDAAANVLR